jgi:hypothetical protein
MLLSATLLLSFVAGRLLAAVVALLCALLVAALL